MMRDDEIRSSLVGKWECSLHEPRICMTPFFFFLGLQTGWPISTRGCCCVSCHNVALPFALINKKKYLIKAKEEEEELLWKLKYFTIAKTIIFQKNPPLNENQKSFKILYNSIGTNLKF